MDIDDDVTGSKEKKGPIGQRVMLGLSIRLSLGILGNIENFGPVAGLFDGQESPRDELAPQRREEVVVAPERVLVPGEGTFQTGDAPRLEHAGHGRP